MLEKETDYGKISVSNKVFENMIGELCQRPELYDRIWLAQRSNVKAKYDEDGGIEVGFSVYVKFGQSISNVAGQLSDMLAETIKKRAGEYPSRIQINISGVRSRVLIKRNMDIEILYDKFFGRKSLSII